MAKVNALVPKKETPVAPSALELLSTFASESAGGFAGRRLKFAKGDFLFGDNSEQMALGTKLIADVRSIRHGSVTWIDNKPDDSNMKLLIAGERPLPRDQLGHTDRALWEVDMNGQPRDPVQATMSIDFYPVDLGRPVTQADRFHFQATSYGARKAIQQIAKDFVEYAKFNGGNACEESPVVELSVNSYQHSNKAFGRIKEPVFTVTDWVVTG